MLQALNINGCNISKLKEISYHTYKSKKNKLKNISSYGQWTKGMHIYN